MTSYSVNDVTAPNVFKFKLKETLVPVNLYKAISKYIFNHT